MEMQDGIYKGRARTWALAESPEKKTPEVAVEFEFTSPGFEGQSSTWHGYLSEKAFDRTIESLRICGWTGDDLADLAGLDTNEVNLVVKNEEYNGKTYPKIQFVNRPGGLAVKEPMAPDKAKSFAASMRSRIRAIDAANGRKAKPANGTRPSDGDAINPDDIPF